jgi:hypothetical protein
VVKTSGNYPLIFIQIAAYRDPELLPTIQDCLANARWPDDLRFGICWQTDEADRCLAPFFGDPRFRIDRVRWPEARGLCWARARIQRLYQGEDYTLQLDSHHRFAPHWDEALLAMLAQTDSRRPILTSYAGMYDPAREGGKRLNFDPFKMVADKFTPSGTIMFRPHSIAGWQDLRRPVRARFVSGHFFFTLGRHCEDYKYDPNLYFAGDEISLSIRSYTLGYDLFHPHRCLIWHEYTRAGRVKIWDDHGGRMVNGKWKMQNAEAPSEDWLPWHARDAISKRRLRKMLREEDNSEDITGYDLGTVRSHRDYEIYAGIDFARRELSPCMRRGDDPPCLDVHGADPWFSSLHCRSAAHCAACRHDESFRASLVKSGMVAARDFPCPFGMSPPDPHEGPGTRLMRLLRRLGFRHTQQCRCQDMALKMNIGGPQWCREHIDEILAVMRAGAEDRAVNPLRLPFIEGAARSMVLHCAKD